jgi:CheY-like chemotaxis protein/two-component sensor histidine kinase
MDGGETVRRIQDYARARTEKSYETVDMNALIEETVEITRTRWKDEAEVRDVRIDVELTLGQVPSVQGNASELREVFTNLIFNAVDAMPRGGRISIASRVEDGAVVVEIRDDGVGMTESVRVRIFDPFFSTKGPNGMGLGMSVVFGILDRHGGRIDVESRVGHGTRFILRLPAAAVEDAPARNEADPGEHRSARILVIDDEPDIVELVSDIFRAHGHEVATADNGARGVELAESAEFDLLFCDLGMREMSGWEVVKAIRARDRAIGVVLLTGWGATLPEDQVADHGIDAVVNKPFEMNRLLTTAAEILEIRDARRAGSPA